MFSQAGIIPDRLLIALEPEAASIYCKHQLEKSNIKMFETGSRNVILDAGGNVYTICKLCYSMMMIYINHNLSPNMIFPTIWYVRPAKPQSGLRIRAV